MKKFRFGIAALCGLIVLAGYALFSGAKEVNSATIAINGMTCPACGEKIAGMLQGLEGVDAAEVSLKTNAAVVKFDPMLITPAALESEISKLGFGTTNFEAQACDPAQKQCETEKSASMDCCAPPAKRSDT